MNSDYLKVEISAETREQADGILNALLKQKLVTGGQIIEAPARFLWKGSINNMNYFTITSFTLQKHREAITTVVSRISIEEVPMIIFLSMDGNEKLLTWIKEIVA